MTGLEIGLLLIGLAIFAASFLVAQKLSPSDLDEIKKMTDTEIKILMDKGVTQASNQIDSLISEHVDAAIEKMDLDTDKETNEKILEISEYSDTVLDSMNKSHDEVMFMYSMLNEKQEKLSEMTREMQEMESTLRYLKKSIKDQLVELEEAKVNVDLAQVPDLPEMPPEMLLSIKEELKKKLSEESNKEKNNNPESLNVNDQIIELHKQGYSEVEIAKQLGRGLGEVKLVLGLFN